MRVLSALVFGGVARRLTAAFVVVSACTVTVGVIGVTQLSNLNHKASAIYTRGTIPATEIRALEGIWYRYTADKASAANAFLSAQLRAANESDAALQWKSLQAKLAKLDTMPLSGPAAAAVHQIEDNVRQSDAVGAQFAAAEARRDLAAAGQLIKQLFALSDQVPPLITQAATSQLTGAKQHYLSARQAYSASLKLILGFLALGILLSVTLAYLTARSLIRPVRSTVKVLRTVANGDLTARVTTKGSDEIADMGTALNATLDSVGGVFRLVTTSAANLSDASERLSDVSTDIVRAVDTAADQAAVVSGAADEVSASVAIVASGTDEMALSIREIAVNASEAAGVAAEAMAAAAETTGTISKLDESSVEIGNVIKVITSIAGQTNLLALNATIEAARAGDAGKGFAVVASEVKDLAQETARATEGIGQRVAAIQADTAGAIEAIARISSVIEKVHAIQTTIASAVEQQNATTNEMGRNVAQAAATSADIARGIAGVAEATNGSTGGAQAATAAAAELAAMSAELQAALSGFTA